MSVIDLPQTHTTLTEWSAIFIGLASLVSAVGAAYAAVMSSRNSYKIQEVHDATNGMKAELVKSTGDRMYAAGRMHGENFPRSRPGGKKPRTSKRKVTKRTKSSH